MPDVNALPVIVSALSGGAVGAIITAIATNQRGRRDLALKFAEKYVDMFDKIAEGKTLLHDPESLALASNRNKVANAANWLEIVASCYLNDLADADILKSLGLPPVAADYYRMMTAAKAKDQAGTEIIAFPEERLQRLVHLKRLAEGAAPRGAV